MADAVTTIPEILKWTSKVCGWSLRLFYPAEKLQRYLLFDILANGDRLRYNFHAQEGTCILTATNLSPFDFIVDRIKVNVVTDKGGTFSCTHEMPHVVKGSSQDTIFMLSKSPMTEQVAKLAKNSERGTVTIEAHIVSNIRSFNARKHIEDVRNIRVLA